MLREELGQIVLNAAHQAYDLEVEQAYEDPEGYEQFGIGRGFTWYRDDE